MALGSSCSSEPTSVTIVLRERNKSKTLWNVVSTAIGQWTKHVDIWYHFVNDMILRNNLLKPQ